MEQDDILQMNLDLGSGYSRIRPLSEGGMGSLYCAHKDSLDVEVVIKKVKPKFRGRMDERAEANILKRLKHKYLPRIYDVIESPSGYIYTIMDLIQGQNMQKYVEQNGPVDQKTAYRWGYQLCEVIAYLHAQKPPILHCDIKPSNIMITPSGDICLIDFNTSLVFSGGELAIGATPGYAAPEQYSRPVSNQNPGNTAVETSHPTTASNPASSLTAAQATNAGIYGTISKRTDVYGIGATLYFAVTGQKPNHSLRQVRPITSYKLKLSKSFLAVIDRAMQKQQDARFDDAREMMRALRDIHEIDGRYKSAVRSQWILAGVSTAALAAGVLLIVFGIYRIGAEHEAAYPTYISNARLYGETQQYEKAAAELEKARAVGGSLLDFDLFTDYESRLDAYAVEAELLYRQGRYDECLNKVGEIVRKQNELTGSRQTWADVLYLAANCCYEQGDYQQATGWYEQAIEFSPRKEFYRDCAIALARQGDVDAAYTMLEDMTARFPQSEQDADYHMVLAELAWEDGDVASALEQAIEVTEMTDDGQTLCLAYELAAQAYRTMGSDKLDEEISLLEEGAERLEETGSGYYNQLASHLAYAYVEQANATGDTGYDEKALQTYEKILESGFNVKWARLNIAVQQEKLGLYDEALETLQAYIEDNPNDYRGYRQLTSLWIDIEQRDGDRSFKNAKEAYETAARLYAQEQAAGTKDPQMDQLKEIIDSIS